MDFKIGDKVKTKLMPMACGLWNRPQPGEKKIIPEFYHSWEVIEIKENEINLIDKKGNLMTVDKDGNGMGEYINHLIYKKTNNK